MVSIPFSYVGIKSVLLYGVYIFSTLYNKTILRLAALVTTFSQTLRTALLAVNGQDTWVDVGKMFLNESFNKFLGAAPNIVDGLNKLGTGDILEAAKLLWIGLASIYMMLWLWNGFRGRAQNTEVDDVETVLILVIWVLASSQIHGSQLLVEMVNQATSLADSLAGLIPDSGNSSLVNESLNKTQSS